MDRLQEVFCRFREFSDQEVLVARHPVEELGRSDGIDMVVPDRPESEFVYLASEGWMREHRGQVVDWFGTILELRHTEGWKRQRKSFLRLTCQLYEKESPRPAWLVVQTCRVKLAKRFPTDGLKIVPNRVPAQCGPNRIVRGQQCISSFNVRLPVRDLFFAAPEGISARDLVLTRTTVDRQFTAGAAVGGRLGQGCGEMQVWWTATPLGDNLGMQALRNGVIPSSMRLLDETTNVTEAVIVSWIKLYPSGSLMRCAFELHPDSGETLSFRAVDLIPLAMSFRMDGEEARLVHRAVLRA